MGLPIILPESLKIMATARVNRIKHVKGYDWLAELGFHDDYAAPMQARVERMVEISRFGTEDSLFQLGRIVAALSLELCRAPSTEGTCRERKVSPVCLTCEARETLEHREIRLVV